MRKLGRRIDAYCKKVADLEIKVSSVTKNVALQFYLIVDDDHDDDISAEVTFSISVGMISLAWK